MFPNVVIIFLSYLIAISDASDSFDLEIGIRGNFSCNPKLNDTCGGLPVSLYLAMADGAVLSPLFSHKGVSNFTTPKSDLTVAGLNTTEAISFLYWLETMDPADTCQGVTQVWPDAVLTSVNDSSYSITVNLTRCVSTTNTSLQTDDQCSWQTDIAVELMFLCHGACMDLLRRSTPTPTTPPTTPGTTTTPNITSTPSSSATTAIKTTSGIVTTPHFNSTQNTSLVTRPSTVSGSEPTTSRSDTSTKGSSNYSSSLTAVVAIAVIELVVIGVLVFMLYRYYKKARSSKKSQKPRFAVGKNTPQNQEPIQEASVPVSTVPDDDAVVVNVDDSAITYSPVEKGASTALINVVIPSPKDMPDDATKGTKDEPPYMNLGFLSGETEDDAGGPNSVGPV